MSIDLIILSDSHGRAIADGARNLGLNIREVTFSGNLWHECRFRYGSAGFSLGRVGPSRQSMADLVAELGVADIMRAGVPVLTTMGFHLGRLVPPFGWHGHVASTEALYENEGALFVSPDFLHQYIDMFRRKHFRFMHQMSRNGKLIVLPPPLIQTRLNYHVFREHIKQRVIAAGIPLFDPMDELAGKDGVLPASLAASDGTHANASYGEKVIKAMKRAKLL